jgi:hypothetical protein
MMRGHWVVFGAALALAGPAIAAEQADLREFRIGERVQDLPKEGYVGLNCAAAPGRTISGWEDYKACPVDASGFHVVGFRYSEESNPLGPVNEAYQGTKVGGHPVLLSLLIGDDGVVDGIRIETDPKARLYLRKKAFLLGEQAKARYGQDGWACHDAEPSADEEPVGGVFVKQHCEKRTATRHVIVDRELYRRAGQPLQDFVGASQVLILRAG